MDTFHLSGISLKQTRLEREHCLYYGYQPQTQSFLSLYSRSQTTTTDFRELQCRFS